MRHIMTVVGIVLVVFVLSYSQPSNLIANCPSGYLQQSYYFGKTLNMPRGRTLITCYGAGRHTLTAYEVDPPEKFKNAQCERLWYQCEGSHGYREMRQYCRLYEFRCRKS
ncbi:MAG: hypothetical protein ACE5FT_02115 [Candidatus Nanoarchaeia archaeon]